jgi:hypothetical protein
MEHEKDYVEYMKKKKPTLAEKTEVVGKLCRRADIFLKCLLHGRINKEEMSLRQRIYLEQRVDQINEEANEIAHKWDAQHSDPVAKECAHLEERKAQNVYPTTDIFDYCNRNNVHAARNDEGVWYQYRSAPVYNEHKKKWDSQDEQGCAKIIANVDKNVPIDGAILVYTHGKVYSVFYDIFFSRNKDRTITFGDAEPVPIQPAHIEEIRICKKGDWIYVSSLYSSSTHTETIKSLETACSYLREKIPELK